MPLNIAQRGIKSTFERAIKEQIDYVEILFHGGEPFMAFQRIKDICRMVMDARVADKIYLLYNNQWHSYT